MKFSTTVTEKEYFSAPSALLMTPKKKYAFHATFDAVPDQYYEATVWKKETKGSGGLALVVADDNSKQFYLTSKRVVEKKDNGWEKLELKFSVPYVSQKINIYLYLIKGDTAYVDDFTVKVTNEKEYSAYSEMQKLHLYFTEEQMQLFEEERERAFRIGVHFSEDWKKGVLSTENDVLPIKARIKGDWLDHIQGKKWSFRIKTRKGKVFNRMKSFSLQTPYSRFFLHEYLSHQLFRKEGLLTTRYGFYPVYINSKSRGIYAMEEHFTKQLIEYNLRREGLLLKFDENPFWRNMAIDYIKNGGALNQSPHFETSRVLPFGTSKVLKSEKLKKQFSVAEGILYQYKERRAPVDELFDIDKMAKFFALLDISNGKHGNAWHNQRFYYNPVICKLEPVNYDNYTDHYDKGGNAYPLGLKYAKNFLNDKGLTLYPHFFKSEKLTSLYVSYLEKYSQPEFIRAFYKTQEDSVNKYLPLIQQEFPHYTVDSNLLLENARRIRKELPRLRETFNIGNASKRTIANKVKIMSSSYQPTLIPYLVNAYYDKNEKGSATFRVENYNNLNVRLLHLEGEDGGELYRFNQPIELEKYMNSTLENDDTTISIPYIDLATHLVVEDLDSNRNYKVELNLWIKSTSISPYQQLLRDENAKPEQLFKAIGDSLILEKGNYTLKNKLLIPENKKVIVKAGVKLDLIEKAAIISHAAFQFEGTKEDSIFIYSSDYTSNGIAVLQAEEKSEVRYTKFLNLNTLNYNNWELSGAVNFYESDVTITNCTFQSNLCEDALNIIRCNFTVDNSSFLDIYADAFDSDFCTGVLKNSNFDRVGNDAIDFSTSQITIKDCDIKNISDKGISGGEGSTLEVYNTKIKACNIGAASKDLSLVKLKNVEIETCTYGLVLLQKKAEYGPARIESSNLSIDDCDTDYLIEKKSKVSLDGKEINGNKENVSKMFY